MNIQDKIIVITGASAGIGLAAAKELSKRGAKIVLAARSAEKLSALEKEISNSLAVPTDVRKAEDVVALIEKVKERFGRIDVLINNAGQGMRSPIETINLDDYHDIMELNVFGVLRAMQAVIPVMREQGGGMILNISSMVSKNYFPYLGAYSSTKYALNALSFTAQQELATDNIRVAVFHPKMTATDFGQNARGEKYVSSAGRPGMTVDTAEQVATAIADQIESEEGEVMM